MDSIAFSFLPQQSFAFSISSKKDLWLREHLESANLEERNRIFRFAYSNFSECLVSELKGNGLYRCFDNAVFSCNLIEPSMDFRCGLQQNEIEELRNSYSNWKYAESLLREKEKYCFERKLALRLFCLSLESEKKKLSKRRIRDILTLEVEKELEKNVEENCEFPRLREYLVNGLDEKNRKERYSYLASTARSAMEECVVWIEYLDREKLWIERNNAKLRDRI